MIEGGSERRIGFMSGDLLLEGILHGGDRREGADLVVVAHPHPLYGGTMDNMVVRRICEAVVHRGGIALRFNFRGVEGSQGRHSGGDGEVEDVLAAVAFVRGFDGGGSVSLAGYSFGAMVALRAASADEGVARIGCVALPVTMFPGAGNDIGMAGAEVLLVAGDGDEVAPVTALGELAMDHPEVARMVRIEGADHFFGGRTEEVGKVVARFLVR